MAQSIIPVIVLELGLTMIFFVSRCGGLDGGVWFNSYDVATASNVKQDVFSMTAALRGTQAAKLHFKQSVYIN